MTITIRAKKTERNDEHGNFQKRNETENGQTDEPVNLPRTNRNCIFLPLFLVSKLFMDNFEILSIHYFPITSN
jgi:hypothetical protein